MCAYVCFPEIARAGRGTAARGAKKTAPWWQIKWRQKKEEKGDYMLCNHDNGKENTEGLKCESLCPEECKHQGCLDITNQNFTQAPGRAASACSFKWCTILSTGSCGTQCCGTCGEAKGALGTQAGTWAPCEVSWKLRVGMRQEVTPDLLEALWGRLWSHPLIWPPTLITLECWRMFSTISNTSAYPTPCFFYNALLALPSCISDSEKTLCRRKRIN